MVTTNKKTLLFFTFSILLICLNSCADKEKEKIDTVLAPRDIISNKVANKLYNTYSDRRVPLIDKYEDSINRIHNKDTSDIKQFNATRYVYFDYKTIKQYIAYIEQEAKKGDVEISTLRFYFGNYPNEEKLYDEENIINPRQNSIFISPTTKKDNKDFLFYIGNNGEKQEAILLFDDFSNLNSIGSTINRSKSYASFINSKPSKPLSSSFVFQGNSLTMNRGGIGTVQ